MRLAATVAAFVACLGYAALRYVVLGDTPASQLPLYVTNKAVSMVALGLLAVAAGASRAELARWAGFLGVAASILHVVMSFPLMRPAYLAKLFAPQGHLTGLAELATLAGALALMLVLEAARRVPALLSRVLLLLLVAGHCAAMGWKAWWQPRQWPGWLPPITLLATLFALFAAGLLAAQALARRLALDGRPLAGARSMARREAT